jgi:transmembrane sensor
MKKPGHQANLIEEVQHWERVLQAGGSAERAAFAAWIRRSPEHLQAYLEHLSLLSEISRLDPDHQFDIDNLLAQSGGNVVPLTTDHLGAADRQSRTKIPRMRWLGYAAMFLMALLVARLSLWPRTTPEWTDYATATGEQRRIALPDGSIIEMNTQSHIRVAYRAMTREIELISGEAVFSVQHNADRPFRVHARTTVIEDVGTQFATYVRPDASTTVSVLDGRVQLSAEIAPSQLRNSEVGSTGGADSDLQPKRLTQPTQISAGEQVRLDANGALANRATLNIAEAASWRQHRLFFEDASLEEVAAEFNRYNRQKIQVVQDVIVAGKRYTATWDPFDPASFIEYLHRDHTLTVQTEGDRTVIQARQ